MCIDAIHTHTLTLSFSKWRSRCIVRMQILASNVSITYSLVEEHLPSRIILSIFSLENLAINYISLADCLYLREICPKLDYLELRTDYEKNILGKCATEKETVSSVTNVCLLFNRWRDTNVKMNGIENLLSFFPNLSTLQVEQRATQITKEQWDNLAQKKAITIIDIPCN